MTRKRVLFHLVGWPVLALFIIAVSQSRVDADPVSEVRNAPVYVQSRPVYNKPTPKPKPTLPKLPIGAPAKNEDKDNVNPNLVTQTVYGFLDFVTTIGNTVMIFTPQTKKAEEPKPSSIVIVASATEEAVVATTASTSPPVTESSPEEDIQQPTPGNRQPKQIVINEDSVPSLESSEYEPQVFATSIISPTTVKTTSLDPEYVNLVSETLVQISEEEDAPAAPSVVLPEKNPSAFIVTAEAQQPSSSGEAPVEEDGSEEVVTSSSKRFTLKLAKTNTVEAVTASPVEVRRDEPTGIVDEIVDTKVNDGTTTIHETKVYGTYIGDQYARVLESSSTILPVIVPSKAPSLAALKPKLAKPQLVIAEKITTPKPEPSTEATSESSHELRTQKSVSSSSDDVPQDEGGYTDEQLDNDSDDTYIESSSSVVVEPTPSASEEQTLYILPQKDDKAELYVSPVPNNNAYSRQPQIAVEVSPAKSFDFIVTATPSRKQFRQTTGKSNRFTNRFNNRGTSSSTESNELASSSSGSVETPAEDSGRRGTNRFRSRNRGRQNSEPEVLPTVSVYSKTVSASPGRRFTTSSRGRSFGKYTSEKPLQEQSYKTARSFGASSVSRYIEPTSSTSIYRFKLNRPTGRWRFKPSPKPKVNIIKTKDDDELTTQASGNIQQATAPLPQQANAPVYYQNLGENGDIQNLEESKTESNELAQDIEPELVPQTVRVATITPTEFDGLDKYLEIATIRSPYVFQAGNVKNTRYITLTKTFTKEHIQPTLASVAEATLENILATKPPYEKILEGSSDVATLPVIALGGDQMTPPLETVTQSFSTTQLMLKTSILPVLYDGVTTLYTLTQSYFVTRLVTAHKTVPPVELFQFVPTKSLTEFNTALQEAGSENREHLLASETEENDANYEHILAPPDELTSVGSDFDPSAMDEKIPKPGSSAGSPAKGKNLAATPGLKAKAEGSAAVPSDLAGLSPEQLAFLRYFNQAPGTGNNFFPPPLLPSQPQFQLTSSPIIVDTSTTIVESKTLRILFGAKATQTTLFSTRVVPTKMTTYVTTSVPVQATAAIPNFFQQAPFPLGYIG